MCMAAILLILSCGAALPPTTTQPFEGAIAAAANYDFARAAELYRAAAASDPDLHRRDQAALRVANIEWRIQHDVAAAERDLERVSKEGEEYPNALMDRSRIAAELQEDFPAARAAAERALS